MSKLRLPQKHIPIFATVVVFLFLFACGSVMYDGFFSLGLIVELLSENAFLGVAALGMTFVILSGGIDLSVGAVIGFTTILIASLTMQCGWPPYLAWAAALFLGSSLGALMGALIHFFAMPAFLVTLGGLFFARGMSFVVNRQSLGIDNTLYDSLSNFGIPLFGNNELPITATIFIVCFIFAVYMTKHTKFARNIYAVGGSEQSANLMGVPVAITKIGVYALSGFCSALAGIVMTLYMGSGNPILGVGLELDVIAVVVIGGTLLTGGVGFVGGTLLGLLIYGTIQQMIYFDGNLSSSLASVAMGVLLLCFILLQRTLIKEKV